ncbi:pyridoxal phosphate-dependent aminotransferase [Achromobacter deleyi]|uniref:pyridoxal phosphate-dependent aminotransferase n=1 Tax=Achromobacter deleyi TaxID=1353891 RepID=UPI0014928C53|nr:pyridoxal phosphate-dependent aminotransferase [Achromobacter deleyi]QVQ27741.1 pyridoxal phosphate-dependent aminotransferase [Achromobacter deleyi]UIP23343.1 pyridoxal phosphate-dependent aminotransferase [Achromobacter deleyi]
MHSDSFIEGAGPIARAGVRTLRSSQIREVANAGLGRADVLPFWFGEPDEETPQAFRDAAIAHIASGQTFYVQTLGVPSLRDSLASYVSKLHSRREVDHIAVTSSGTSALMTAVQAIVGNGDHVVVVTPLWPNLVEMPKVLGASVTTVPLSFSPAGWRLDVDALLDALTPDVRALLVNSPNNPTGWVMSAQEQRVVLEHCRKHGIWIISDDVYERYYYDATVAPTFLDIADENDRVISCNSFSKAWLMTGWRIGWLVVPRAVLPEIGKLIEYSNTCTPGFVQTAAQCALEQGEPVIARTVARLRLARDHLAQRLQEVPGVELAGRAPGAMYTFFRIQGVTDSLSFCKDLVARGGLGLAPGTAFGPEGEGYLRWCYASAHDRLDEGVNRLSRFLP